MDKEALIREFINEHPESCNDLKQIDKKEKKKQKRIKYRFLCQCKRGHVFDYRQRIRFEIDNEHFAPCQGKCPECGDTDWSFVMGYYPIKFNFIC